MPGLTHPELHDLVGEELFVNRVFEGAEYTVDTTLETGFAGYRQANGGVVLSDVLHPDEDYAHEMEEFERRRLTHPSAQELARMFNLPDDEFQQAISVYGEEIARMPRPEGLFTLLQRLEGEEVVDHMPEMALGRLTTDEDVRLRRDLVVVAHTHPLLHLRQRDPRSFLLPSATDLNNYGDNLAANDGLIEGTVATHQRLGGVALFLFRAPDQSLVQRLQAVEPNTNVTDELLTDLGLRTATVVYNRRSANIRSGLHSLGNLYA